MANPLLSAFKQTDRAVSKLYLRFFREKNALIIFFFHGLAQDSPEIASPVVEPSNVTTVRRFRQFVEYFLERGYAFVSPDDLIAGLSPDQKYVMATFDDGYSNNQLILPVLKEFKIPVTLYISTNHVKTNRSFWWDVLYRQRAKSGASVDAIHLELELLKSKPYQEIEARVADLFGESAFKPVGEIDRPMTPTELARLSQEKYVFIGNHTQDHAILTNLNVESINNQIAGAQNDLKQLVGFAPSSIAYPNGRYNQAVLQVARQVGLRIGLTVVGKKNNLPLNFSNGGSLELARFHLSNHADLNYQCDLIRSDILIYPKLRAFVKKNG
ncbi:hypothetical protein BROC_00873 [Candidatus Brocadiaceae bacterium]|nr:hypothetical protein BROC_00873 [Candidatus Brocadiaceae bacterium]